jgi:type I restriction enzyme S subunit
MSVPRRFKRHPAYKDSGVEWLREIPAHWEVKRLKTLASVQLSNVDKKSVEGEEPVRLCNYTDVYYNERITSDLEFMTATAAREQVRRFSLLAGDVLITKDSESWTDIAVPAVVVDDLPDVLCGYHLALVRPGGDAFGAFLSRAFSAIGPRNQFQVAANGITRFGLGSDAIRTGLFAMPPEPEQRAIAAFLDRETARIDALVAKKERLIELLQEKRTALITRAVTRGLDPTVPMKDSGVEWLGEIPAHWEVKRLKHVLRAAKGAIKTGPFGSQLQSAEMQGGDIKVYNQRSVLDRDFAAGDNYVSLEKFRALSAFEAFPGDLLITTRGSIGRCAILPEGAERGILHPCLMRVQPDQRWILTRFLEIQIEECFIALDQLKYMSNATTIDVIYSESLREVWLTLPPLQEQRAIEAFLDEETIRLDALIAKVRDAIDRLKELRTALISAAVTGKIDVQEEVA